MPVSLKNVRKLLNWRTLKIANWQLACQYPQNIIFLGPYSVVEKLKLATSIKRLEDITQKSMLSRVFSNLLDLSSCCFWTEHMLMSSAQTQPHPNVSCSCPFNHVCYLAKPQNLLELATCSSSYMHKINSYRLWVVSLLKVENPLNLLWRDRKVRSTTSSGEDSRAYPTVTLLFRSLHGIVCPKSSTHPKATLWHVDWALVCTNGRVRNASLTPSIHPLSPSLQG